MGFTLNPDPGERAAFTKDLAVAKDAGATWVRLGISSWFAGGIDQGRYIPNARNMAALKAEFVEAKAAGFKVSLTLASSQNSNSWSEAQFVQYNRLMWHDIAVTLAGTYDAVQIFNEHDGANFRDQSPLPLSAMNTAYLIRIRDALAAGRAEFHAVSPSVPVYTTLLGYPVNDATQARWWKFYDVVAPAVDLIGVNVYPETGADTIASVPRRLRALQDRYGKRTIVPETGLPASATVYSFDAAKTAIPAMIKADTSANPVAVIVYMARNTGENTRYGEHMFGIVEHGTWVHRPHYDAVAAAVRAANRG